MSTELHPIKASHDGRRDLNVTQFFGGIEKGLCIQVTQGIAWTNQDAGFITLTKEEALRLAARINEWVAGDAEPFEGE